MKLRRTTLFIPGTHSEELARETIKTCGADIICLDLEDTVVHERKQEARESIVRLLHEDIWGRAIRALRINAISTEYAEDDILEVIGGAGDLVESILLSKPQGVEEILWLDALIEKIRTEKGFKGKIGYVVAIESAEVLTNIDAYSSCSPNVQGLGFAIGDLSASLGVNIGAYLNDRSAYPGDMFHFHRARIILAARTHGLWAMDAPWPVVTDDVALEEDARWGAMMGFNGKLVLVPSQVRIVHEAYRPSEAEIKRAQQQLDEMERMKKEGSGAGVSGDQFIDPVVIAPALATLERAKAPI